MNCKHTISTAVAFPLMLSSVTNVPIKQSTVGPTPKIFAHTLFGSRDLAKRRRDFQDKARPLLVMRPLVASH